MKNAGTNKITKGRPPEKKDLHGHIYSIQQEVEHFKKEKDILLAVSNDIMGVREKNDLIKIFSSRLNAFSISHIYAFP